MVGVPQDLKQSHWLWGVACVSFAIAVMLFFAPNPAYAEYQLGDVRFTLSELLIFVALAAAWGDARRQIMDIRRELDRLLAAKKED